MIYILCEDSTSGFKFFKYLRTIYGLDESSCSVENSGGNTNFDSYMKNNILDKLERDDKLVLVFDNIGTTVNFNPNDIILNATAKCSEVGVKLYITDYYCFEELFLTYSDLSSMLILTNQELIKLQELQQNIYTGVDYSYWDIDFWCNNTKIKLKTETREKFSASLLSHLTKDKRNRKLLIVVDKSNIGACWIKSCSDLITDDAKLLGDINNPKRLDINCNSVNCKFCRNKFTDKEKINDIALNSVCSINHINTCTFEEIFKA